MNVIIFKTLKCEKCDNQFVWSEEEQKIYRERGLEEPKYCPICRGMMKAAARDKSRAKYMENSK